MHLEFGQVGGARPRRLGPCPRVSRGALSRAAGPPGRRGCSRRPCRPRADGGHRGKPGLLPRRPLGGGDAALHHRPPGAGCRARRSDAGAARGRGRGRRGARGGRAGLRGPGPRRGAADRDGAGRLGDRRGVSPGKQPADQNGTAMDLITALVAALVVVALGWLLLVGFLWLHRPSRAVAGPALRLIPDLIRLVRRLLADPGTPTSVRIALAGLLAYLLSPVDLIPDFVPVIGAADDLIIAAVVLRWAGQG